MPKPTKLTEKHLKTALGLQSQIGRLAALNRAKAVVQKRKEIIDKQITALEAEILASAAISPKQMSSLFLQYKGANVEVALGGHEDAKQRHSPKEKRAFLLECLRRHQKLHPADQAVRLEWIRREFVERFTHRPISNTTIYFTGIIDKSWYLPRSNTRNRAIDLKRAMRGLSTPTK